MDEVRRLPAAEVARLRAEPFTYTEVGATADFPAAFPSGLPDAYRLLRVRAVIGRGRPHFEWASGRLTSWRMHLDSGLRVATSTPDVRAGSVVVCRLGPVRIPCRVVYLVDEPGRRGFAYGTLPGHPESGEESFVVEIEGDEVTLTVTAFSRAGRLLTRLGGPVSWWVQRRAVGRYVEALRRSDAPHGR